MTVQLSKRVARNGGGGLYTSATFLCFVLEFFLDGKMKVRKGGEYRRNFLIKFNISSTFFFFFDSRWTDIFLLFY